MKKTRAHVFVEGRVQGVFFRQSTSERARLLGVTGWARNLADGRVEAVFEGEEASVHSVIEFVKVGPPQADVMNVDILWEEYAAEFSMFSIRRDQ